MKKINIAKVCIIGSIICFAWAIIETAVEGIKGLIGPVGPFYAVAFQNNWYPLVPAVILLAVGIIMKKNGKKKNN